MGFEVHALGPDQGDEVEVSFQVLKLRVGESGHFPLLLEKEFSDDLWVSLMTHTSSICQVQWLDGDSYMR